MTEATHKAAPAARSMTLSRVYQGAEHRKPGSNFSQTAAYIWSLADLLRGDFKQSQYGRVILPFTILRRLECVLESTKPRVLKQIKKLKAMKKLEEDAREKFLLNAADQSFYNTSSMDLSKLGSTDIKSNLLNYVDSFSKDAREIFEHFKFSEFIAQLEDANLLFKVVQKVATTDLSPQAISNHDMGLVFEELIRRFAESSNETAGEHFTPRDIVRLTTSLVFMEDDDALTEEGIIEEEGREENLRQQEALVGELHREPQRALHRDAPSRRWRNSVGCPKYFLM